MWNVLNLDECDGEGDFCVNSKTILNAVRALTPVDDNAVSLIR